MAGYKSRQSITRPANITAYTAGDVLGGAFQLTGLPSATSYTDVPLLITSVDLRALITAIPAGMTSFRMHLYSATPPSAIADNSPWDRSSADEAVYLGYVDLGSPADDGSTLYCQVEQVSKQIHPGTTGVFAYLVTNGAFTPAANSEVYTVTVHAATFA